MSNFNKKSYIYYINNIVNEKKYIGQTMNLNLRFGKHRSELKNNIHPNNHLQKSYNKYGKNSFEFIVLEECEIGVSDERETYWIKFYKSNNRDFGYNLESGGRKNKKHSDETKKKMSKSNIGKNLGKKRTEEEKKKMSLSHIGKMIGEMNPFFGKKHSEESKRKISENNARSNLGKNMTDGQKERLRMSNIGRKATPEQRKNMSNAHIGKMSGEKNPSYGKYYNVGIKKKNAKSNYIGVSFRGSNSTWVVRFRYKGRQIYLGSFDEEIKAAKEYNRYIIENNIDRPMNKF